MLIKHGLVIFDSIYTGLKTDDISLSFSKKELSRDHSILVAEAVGGFGSIIGPAGHETKDMR